MDIGTDFEKIAKDLKTDLEESAKLIRQKDLAFDSLKNKYDQALNRIENLENKNEQLKGKLELAGELFEKTIEKILER